MRPDGRIERWNELRSDAYQQSLVLHADDGRIRLAGASSIARFWHLIGLALKEHQSWFVPSTFSPKVLFFPYARYLRVGMKIRNVTSGAVYTVLAVEEREYVPIVGEPVSCPCVFINRVGPSSSDRLYFEDENYIRFRPSFGNSWANTVGFDHTAQGQPGPWTDTITYYLQIRESGTVESQPFQGHRERRPRNREYIFDPLQPDIHVDIRGGVFDNIAQFDCWSKDSTRADQLADYFESFMELWSGVLAWNGLERVWFWKRGMDAVDKSWRDDIQGRSLQYFFRTETVTANVIGTLKAIALNVSVTGEILDEAAASQVAASGLFTVEVQES